VLAHWRQQAEKRKGKRQKRPFDVAFVWKTNGWSL
jgi:hypothetical protein